MRPSPSRPLLLVALAACSTAPQKEPTRSPQGLFITGRAKYDAHFKETRQFAQRVADLEARVRGLPVPVAAVLELPPSASNDDLALGLRKVAKRAARAGVRAEIRVTPSATSPDRPPVALSMSDPTRVSPRVVEALEVATKAVTDAVSLRPDLDATYGHAERLRIQGDGLRREAQRAFLSRGSNYVRAVARELAEEGHRLDDAIARLEAARSFVVTLADDLASATVLESPSP